MRKILQIAPIALPLRADIKYGGIERVVLALAKVFSQKGHTVLTAATADSQLSGRLLPTIPHGAWSPYGTEVSSQTYEKHIEKTLEYIFDERPDIVHDHTGNFVLSEAFKKASESQQFLREVLIVVTPHELKRFRQEELPPGTFNIHFTALSEYQKSVFQRFIPIERVIHNGVFMDDFSVSLHPGKYLFSLGSIEYDKGQDLAVQVALATGLPLKIGGRIAEMAFYNTEIKPYLSKQIEYIGELNDQQKNGYYQNSLAFLAPIRIGDCFTLVRIESLAAGIPVITLDTGSAKEAIVPGQTGYLIPYEKLEETKVIDALVKACRSVNTISRAGCRAEAKQRFDWETVGQRYLQFYEEIIRS